MKEKTMTEKFTREVVLKITLQYDDTHLNDEAESVDEMVNPHDHLAFFNLSLDGNIIKHLVDDMLIGAIEDSGCNSACVTGSVSIASAMDY
jgi:hypothetical protein